MEIEQEQGGIHYLGYGEIAEMMGVSTSTLRAYRSTNRMPSPDATIGNVPGWTHGTIQRWRKERPGMGARTDLKEKKERR